MPLFHDRSADDRAFLVLPAGTVDDYTADALASAQREALAEGLRLLYVALTRAKHRVSVVWGGGLPGLEHSALAYLLHQAQGSGLDADALRAATAERVKKLPDAQLLAELQQLVAAAAGAVGVRSLCTDDDPARYRAAPISGAALRARRATWPTYPQLRVGSFSSLIESHKTARMPAQAQVNGSDVLDRDALADRTAPASALADAVPEARIALADFPAGASVGHLVHAVYEVADFQASQTDLEQHVREVLADYAADAQWAPQLTAAIFDSLHTPLAAAGGALPSLSSIAGKQRLNELEFTFPVVDPSLSRDPDAALRSAELAAVLRQHARNPSEQAYADQLAKLRFAPLRGFLRGFIDLIAEHEGRYYVLDYKSNRLGDVASDYRRAQLELVMQRHHYTLQYLLYTVALHRYLALRLSGYDYEQHMGGVYYLFIRGMSTKNEPGTGVLFERPTRALIEDLSRWLQQPEAQA
jgi:exodeoxyribonuclease V beta subunit